MRSVEPASRILSQDEIEAVLGELEDARAHRAARDRAYRELQRPDGRSRGDGFRALQRALERFGAEYGKSLSSSHQTRLVWSLLRIDETELGAFAQTLLPLDRVAAYTMEPGATGLLSVSRPLFFAWLSLAFGAPRAAKTTALQRALTRIEGRFLARIATDVLGEIERFAGDAGAGRTSVLGVEEPSSFHERSEPVLVATFDVSGFGDLGRVRVALPRGPFEPGGASAAAGAPHAVRSRVMEADVEVRAEIGSVELPLSRIASLRVGDLIPIDGAGAGAVVIRVEGTPKFCGLRGTVEGRQAVQVTERLDAAEDGDDGGSE